jgi:thiol-disulfide isomerase/thioredoxin
MTIAFGSFEMKLAFLSSLCVPRRALWLTLGVCSLFIMASCGGDASQSSQQAATPTGTNAPRTTFPMPPVSQSRTTGANPQQGFMLLDGRRMRVSDYLGQVVVLDFWATYCPPCLEEIPHLVELQRQYGPKGLQVIGLNVGGPEDRPNVPKFVQDLKIQYTLGYPDAGMTDLYLGSDDRIPQTLVIDRKGRIVKHFVGYDKTVPGELAQAVQTALAAGAD